MFSSPCPVSSSAVTLFWMAKVMKWDHWVSSKPSAWSSSDQDPPAVALRLAFIKTRAMWAVFVARLKAPCKRPSKSNANWPEVLVEVAVEDRVDHGAAHAHQVAEAEGDHTRLLRLKISFIKRSCTVHYTLHNSHSHNIFSSFKVV